MRSTLSKTAEIAPFSLAAFAAAFKETGVGRNVARSVGSKNTGGLVVESGQITTGAASHATLNSACDDSKSLIQWRNMFGRLSSLVLSRAREDGSWAFTTASRLHQEEHLGTNCTVLLLSIGDSNLLCQGGLKSMLELVGMQFLERTH
jgi:hypothetical protein